MAYIKACGNEEEIICDTGCVHVLTETAMVLIYNKNTVSSEKGGAFSTQTVYIDVLIGVNLFVNYFLLLAVAKFFYLSIRRVRLIAAALLGAAFSLSIFLPELPPAPGLLVKLAFSAAIIRAAFSWQGRNGFLRSLVCFYLMSFAFAGFMLCLWYLVSPQGMIIKNSVVYFNISPFFLLAATVLCYAAIRAINRFTGSQKLETLDCRLVIERAGKTACCMARTDTGNSLREPFSGYPVVVVQKDLIQALVPEKEEKTAFRLIPFQAVSGDGLLSAFRPDRMTVEAGGKKREVKSVYIAVCETALSGGSFGALIGPELMP